MNGPKVPWSLSPLTTTGRTLMLVDIQNLAGTLCLTANDVQWVRDAVTQSEVVPLRTQIVVACHRRNVAVVAFGWRNARILSAGRPAVRVVGSDDRGRGTGQEIRARDCRIR